MNVLVIDDNQIDLLINQRVILNLRPTAHVVSCLSGIEGLKFIEQCISGGICEQFSDLILLDIRMPLMDGFEFLDKMLDMIKHCEKRPFVVMVTSSIDTGDYEKSQTYPEVKGYLSKPLKQTAMLEILEKLNF